MDGDSIVPFFMRVIIKASSAVTVLLAFVNYSEVLTKDKISDPFGLALNQYVVINIYACTAVVFKTTKWLSR